MPNVKVQIPIRLGFGSESYLLETYFDMDFLPDIGDDIHVCKNAPGSSLSFVVDRRYWNESGKSVLILPQQIIDPPEDGELMPPTWEAWWTDRDGDLIELLLENGWKHYGT